MAKDRDSHEFKSALGTSALPADRYGLRPSALDPEDDPNLQEERAMRSLFNNASRIPHGHAQLMAAIATGRSAEPRTSIQTEKERQRQEEHTRYVSQEMQRLAEWNAKVVTIAGVQMTNEDAQRARRRFIENEDEYAERAVEHGLIRDGEQGALKHAMRRREALEDRVGRGNASNDERRELEDLKVSRMGRATDQATAQIHTKSGIELAPSQRATENAYGAHADELSNARDIFQSAPMAKQAFTEATQPIIGNSEPEAAPAAFPTPSRQIARTGLDI